MDVTIISVIGLLILFLFLFLGMPIGFGMMLIAFCGTVYVIGTSGGLSILRTFPYQYASSYDLVVIPLFVLMAEIAYGAGISWDLYYGANRILGGTKGSLAMATVFGCAGFAAVSGSSFATAATIGSVAIPEMKKFHYDKRLASGVVAAGGSIGILIPPSVILILYAIMTEQSIGKLFMAGFFPGLLEASLYLIVIYIIVRLRPSWAPPSEKVPWREKLSSLKNAWIPLLLFIVVIGGIYIGIFTPTEAAAIGALGSFIVLFARGRANRQSIGDSIRNAGRTTGMIFMILIGAMALNFFLGITRLPLALADFVGSLEISPISVVMIIMFIYLLLGCIMDPMSMMLLTVPIYFPLLMKLGLDPIWFGILAVRAVEMGLITPPIGINVFVIKGVARDTSMYEVFSGIIPFLAADIVCVALLIIFPQISLFLPNTMY